MPAGRCLVRSVVLSEFPTASGVELNDSAGRRPLATLVTFRRRALLALLLVLALPLAGCSNDQGQAGIRFDNRTHVTVDVSFRNLDGQESVLVDDLPPDRASTYNGFTTDCTKVGTFIARDSDGGEVARRFGPACRQATWVIEPSSSSSPAP